MKGICLLLLILLPAAASAIKKADDDSYQAIEDLLQHSASKELDISILRSELTALRNLISRSPGSSNANEDRDPDIRIKKEELERSIRERNLIMTRAIRVTLRAYDIVPYQNGPTPMPQGISAHHRNRGATIEFTPVYDPALAERHFVQTNAGPRRLDPPKHDSKAYTTINGSSVLYKPLSGPRELALILFHEKRHFDQLTDPEQANLSYADKEYRAFSDTLRVMGQIGYTEGSQEERDMKKLLDTRIRDFKMESDYEKTVAGRITARLNDLRRRLPGVTPDADLKSEFSLSDSALSQILSDAVRLERSVAASDAIRLRKIAFDYCSMTGFSGENVPSFLNNMTITAESDLEGAAAFNPEHGDCLLRLSGKIDTWRRLGHRITMNDLLRFSLEDRRLAPLPPAPPAPPEAAPPPVIVLAPNRVASEEMRLLAVNACQGDWATAAQRLSEYSRLTGYDLSHLENVASHSQDACVRTILHLIISMHRAGESLTLQRLQTEAATFLSPPPLDDYIDPRQRENPGDCIRRGIWTKVC